MMEISNRKKFAHSLNLSDIKEGENHATTSIDMNNINNGPVTGEASSLLEDNDTKKTANSDNGRFRFDRTKKSNFKMSTLNENSQLNGTTTNINNNNNTTMDNNTTIGASNFLKIFGGPSLVGVGGASGSDGSRFDNHHHHHRFDTSPKNVTANSNYRSNIEFYRLKLTRSKLKAVTRTSALLSGFAMVAMVELGLDYGDYFEDMIRARKVVAQSGNFVNSHVTTAFKPSNISLVNNSTNSSITTTTTASPIAYSTPAYIDESDIRPFLVPEPILILYAIVTCLLVGVHMLALMISTCILPQIEASAFDTFDLEQYYYEQKHNSILNQSCQHINNPTTPGVKSPPPQTSQERRSSGNGNLAPNRTTQTPNSIIVPTPAIHINNGATTPLSPSPHILRKNNRYLIYDGLGPTPTEILFPYNQFHRFIELAWISSTVIGIFLFIVEIGLVCYIKFYPISMLAALSGAIVMTPILIMFVIFTITFYRRLAGIKLGLTKLFLHQVDNTLRPFNDHVI